MINYNILLYITYIHVFIVLYITCNFMLFMSLQLFRIFKYNI